MSFLFNQPKCFLFFLPVCKGKVVSPDSIQKSINLSFSCVSLHKCTLSIAWLLTFLESRSGWFSKSEIHQTTLMFKAFKDKTKSPKVSSFFACLQRNRCLTRLHSEIYQFKFLVLLICTNIHFVQSDLWPFLNHALLYNSAEVCEGTVSHQTPFRNLLI